MRASGIHSVGLVEILGGLGLHIDFTDYVFGRGSFLFTLDQGPSQIHGWMKG